MTLEQEIQADPKDFFGYMKDLLVKEVYENTGRTITHYTIKKGFSYKFDQKKGKKVLPVTYTVKTVKPNTLYEAEIRYPDTKTWISYELTPTQKGTRVRFEKTTTEISTGKIKEEGMIEEHKSKNRFAKQMEAAEVHLRKA